MNDATLLQGVTLDMIYNMRSELQNPNGELQNNPEALSNMLYGIECLCEQAQGALSAISYKDIVNVEGL